MTQISFDVQAQGFSPRDVQSADVSGFGGANALPAVMRRKLVSQSAEEAVRLSDIYRVPVLIGGQSSEDIDARTVKVRHSDKMKLKVVGGTAYAPPEKPWVAAGLSRAAWYRKQKAKD